MTSIYNRIHPDNQKSAESSIVLILSILSKHFFDHNLQLPQEPESGLISADDTDERRCFNV